MTTTRSWRGILAVTGSALSLFWPGAVAFGLPGVLGQYWQQAFGVGKGAVGAIMFFMLAALGIFMFLVGRWQDRLGPRLAMSIGGAATGLSLLMLPFAPNMNVVYLWGFISGAASCFVMIPALTVVQRWYPRRRGLVSGIVNLVFGSAAAIMAPLFARMLGTMGYVTMTTVVAILALVFGVAVAQLVSRPPEGFAVRSTDPDADRAVHTRSLTARQSVHTRNVWLLWLVWALQGAAGIAMVSLAVGFGVSKGYAFESAVVILVAFSVTNGLSRILTGYLSDHMNRTRTMGATFLVAGAAYFALPSTDSLWGIALLAALVGFGFGTLFSVSAPLAVDCFGIGHFGVVYGLIFTAYGFLSGVLGPLLGGVLVDTAGGYRVAFVYLGTLCVVSALLIQFVGPRATQAGSQPSGGTSGQRFGTARDHVRQPAQRSPDRGALCSRPSRGTMALTLCARTPSAEIKRLQMPRTQSLYSDEKWRLTLA